jgi:hypothetical protein
MRVEKEEIWLGIKDYEGLYEVSSFGRVKSLERWVKCGKGEKLVKDKILKLNMGSEGYYRVNLYKPNNKRTKKVHQLVAIAFLNHQPNGVNVVVDHKNNNKLDNLVTNLQLITTRENSSKDRDGYSSKFIGVSWNKTRGKWYSGIWINGKTESLGSFTDELEAHEAYQTRLAEHLTSQTN